MCREPLCHWQGSIGSDVKQTGFFFWFFLCVCVHPNCVTQVYRLDNKQCLCVLSYWPAAGMNQTVQVTVLLHSGDEILLLRR